LKQKKGEIGVRVLDKKNRTTSDGGRKTMNVRFIQWGKKRRTHPEVGEGNVYLGEEN